MSHGDDIIALAPGRVNLIGDHTDYAGGLCLPMAIDLGTTIRARRTDERAVRLTSADEAEPAAVPIGAAEDPRSLQPPWARYVAGVVAELRPAHGITGHVTTTIPVGAGLSSSAALEVATALALGAHLDPVALAQLCQRAEQVASGVPCGVMDQLASAAGVAGHALVIDCARLTVEPVPVPPPDEAEIVVVHSELPRTLAGSAYAERRAQCEAAAAIVGPLPEADPDDIAAIEDETLRQRAAHVHAEHHRVTAFAAALRAGDLAHAGELMAASHRSLAENFAVSTPEVDALVRELQATPGVIGARMTGGGFGGCVVVLARPGADLGAAARGKRRWTVTAAAGARLL